MKQTFSILCLALLLCTSCATVSKRGAMRDLRQFTTELETNGAQYSANDWIKAKNDYDEINNNLKRYEYTAQEKEEINQLKGQCVGYFAKSVVENVTNKVTDAVNTGVNVIKGIKKALTE